MLMRKALIMLGLITVAAFSPAGANDADPDVISYDGLMRYVIKSEKPVLVNFWATWCGPCLKELPGLKRIRLETPKDRLDMIAVSLDYDPGAMALFLKKNPLNFPNYLAAPDLMELLHIQSIPKTLLFDAEGQEIINHDGYLSEEELRSKIERAISGKGGREEAEP